MLPGCSVKELGERPGERTGGHCLLISRPDGGSCIWLLADNTPEFNEWKEMLEIAANKQRSRVGCQGQLVVMVLIVMMVMLVVVMMVMVVMVMMVMVGVLSSII